jgi:hypothetical protein
MTKPQPEVLCECGFGSLVLDPQVFHLSFQPYAPNIFTWFSATNAEPAVTRGARINPYDPKTCFAVSALHANERATLQGRQRAFDAGAHGSDVEGMRFAAKHLPIYIHSPDLQRKLHCSSFFAILFHCILHQSYSKAAIEYFGMNRVIFYSKDLEIITEILVPIEDYASFQCSNSMHFSFTCRSAKPRDGFQGGQNIHEPANLLLLRDTLQLRYTTGKVPWPCNANPMIQKGKTDRLRPDKLRGEYPSEVTLMVLL